MAEITQTASHSGGKVRSRKLSTKIDMTPMVDLGFLLITFFMLTTTLQMPKSMDLGMPEPDGTHTTELPASKALSIYLDEGSKVLYREGLSETLVKSDFKAIREVLLASKERMGSGFFVMIKATEKAEYGRLVDILDELMITNCNRYAIAQLDNKDKQLLDK